MALKPDQHRALIIVAILAVVIAIGTVIDRHNSDKPRPHPVAAVSTTQPGPLIGPPASSNEATQKTLALRQCQAHRIFGAWGPIRDDQDLREVLEEMEPIRVLGLTGRHPDCLDTVFPEHRSIAQYHPDWFRGNSITLVDAHIINTGYTQENWPVVEYVSNSLDDGSGMYITTTNAALYQDPTRGWLFAVTKPPVTQEPSQALKKESPRGLSFVFKSIFGIVSIRIIMAKKTKLSFKKLARDKSFHLAWKSVVLVLALVGVATIATALS